MATLTTDKGKTYEITFIVDPAFDGSCVIRLDHNGPLADVAQDFEGINHFEVDDDGSISSHDGYSALYSICKGAPFDNNIQISLRKPK